MRMFLATGSIASSSLNVLLLNGNLDATDLLGDHTRLSRPAGSIWRKVIL